MTFESRHRLNAIELTVEVIDLEKERTQSNALCHIGIPHNSLTRKFRKDLLSLLRPQITVNAMLPHATSRCFVYGTLMAPEVLRSLLGRIPEMDPRPAFLPPNYSRHPVKGRVFPGVIKQNPKSKKSRIADSEQERVKGILLTDITPEEMKIFDWFEDVAYDRCTVQVQLQPSAGGEGVDANGDTTNDDTEADSIDADMYLWNTGDELLDLQSSWSFEEFSTQNLEWYLRSTVGPCKEEYDKRR